MPLYTLTLPTTVNPFEVLPERLNAYLAGKGYLVTGGTQIWGDGTATVAADRDPSADVDGFTNAPSAQDQAVSAATAYLKSTYAPYVQGIAPANRTPEQRALLAMLVLLKAKLTP